MSKTDTDFSIPMSSRAGLWATLAGLMVFGGGIGWATTRWMRSESPTPVDVRAHRTHPVAPTTSMPVTPLATGGGPTSTAPTLVSTHVRPTPRVLPEAPVPMMKPAIAGPGAPHVAKPMVRVSDAAMHHSIKRAPRM